MSDSMVDRLDDHEPVTITEAPEIPQPRVLGSPLPHGNGNQVSVPPTYADLEVRSSISHLGPVLATIPHSNFSFASSPLLGGSPAAKPVPPESTPRSINIAPETINASAPAPKATLPGAEMRAAEPAPTAQEQASGERQRALQARSQEGPSKLQRAAGIIRHAIPIVQKFLPLLDGNVASVVSNLLRPAPAGPPAPPAPRVDLAPLKEEIAELQAYHKELSDRIAEQNTSLKHVEDRLELVREATDRNTLEQQELLEDLKKMRIKVNVVAAVAIGLLAISLLVNLAQFLHIQRVLP